MRLEECQHCPHLSRFDGSVVECAPDPFEGETRELAADVGLGGDVRVGETMRGHTVSIAMRVPLRKAIEVIAKVSLSCATGIVVDDDNCVVGTIELLDAGQAADMVCTDKLTRAVVPIRESATLATAIARMAKEHRRTLPVVDDAGRAVGLISDLDALRWVTRQKAPP